MDNGGVDLLSHCPTPVYVAFEQECHRRCPHDPKQDCDAEGSVSSNQASEGRFTRTLAA